jgi:glycosyltransferase involved in cell wall biosynthesis
MNIMVYDVAAESGGAISVLKYFYDIHKMDKDNHYFYMLSTYQLPETDNIIVVNAPKVKNSWLNRLYFDLFGVKRYISQFQIENTIVPGFRGKQTVYEHNALPFSEYRFSLIDNRKMWIYQNIIGKFMLYAIKNSDSVIVQTEWMKEAIAKKIPTAEKKTLVKFPEVSILKGYSYERPNPCIFFYPANAAPFKNHSLILKACLKLKEKGIGDYSVVFTLDGNETNALKKIYEKGKEENLNIQWMGNMSREEVFDWYSRSVLVFPSYIETVGLPIYEAMSVGSPLLLSDCKYAKNVAGEYKDVAYFHYDDANLLAEYMCLEIMKCRRNNLLSSAEEDA